MSSKTLHFENARLAQQLFNNEPRNLQLLEEQFGVKTTAREGWIKLDGPDDQVECGAQLFQSDFQSEPIGLSLVGSVAPVAMPRTMSAGELLLTDTFGSP